MKNVSRIIVLKMLLAISLSGFVGVVNANPDEINVAYFLEWPTPNQKFQVEKYYDKQLGVKVNWKSFGTGNEMTAAMVSGDVDISYSQGLVPYIVAASKGVDLTLVGVAMSYAENDNCIVRNDAGINQNNAKKLEGMKVGTPIGNVTHYKMLKVFDHLGVNPNKVKILQMSGQDAAAALVRGDIVMGCAFGGPLTRMKTVGKPLMSATEQESIGIRVFDVITVTNKFADKYPDMVTNFLQVTEDANRQYAKSPKKFYKSLAKASGMKMDDTVSTLKKFTFLTKSEQLSKAWLGGTVQEYTVQVAKFFEEQKQLKKSLRSYDKYIDTSYLQKVK